MKSALKHLGIGALWVGVFFGSQLLASVAVSFIASLYFIMKLGLEASVTAAVEWVEGHVLLISLISYLILIAVLLLWFLLLRRPLRQALSIKKVSSLSALSASMLGVGASFLVGAIFLLLPEAWLEEYIEASAPLAGGPVLTLLVTVIGAPLCEEIIFRALVYPSFRKGIGRLPAIFLTALVFGVLHGQWLWILYATVLGILLTLVFDREESLLPPLLLHFFFNLFGSFSLFGEMLVPPLILGALLFGSGLWLYFFHQKNPTEVQFHDGI